MESRPPVHDATSLGLSSAPTTAAIQPPTYSSCFYSYSRDQSLVEHIPPGSRTSQRVFRDPLDCSGSLVASSVDQSSTIAPGSSTRSTCALHPPSSREVGPGCEDLEFPSSASESPPPSYETAMITLRPRPVKITSRDDTSGQGHNLSTMSSTSRLGPSVITSRDLTSCPDRAVPPVPSTPRADPSINRLPMPGIHRPIADRISRSTPCNTFVEQTGRIHSEDTLQSVHRCGRKIDQRYQFIGSCCFSIVFVVLFIFLCKLIKDYYFV